MTNAYFDQGESAPYTGRLAICPECGCAVAVTRKQQHLEVLHTVVEPADLVEDGTARAEIVAWDPEDETA